VRLVCSALLVSCFLFCAPILCGEVSALVERGTSTSNVPPGETPQEPGPMAGSHLPNAQNWGSFYEALLKASILSPAKLQEVRSRLEQTTGFPTYPHAFRMTVRGYAERHPSESPTEHEGGGEGLCWFQPVFGTFQTPGGTADKVSWLRESHLRVKAKGLWEITEKLWHETYFQEPDYPLGRTNGTRKVHVLQNAHGYVWERTGLWRAALDRSCAVTANQLLDLAGGSSFRPSPLTMPSVFGGLPAVRVTRAPDIGYVVEVDGCPLFLLRWKLPQLVESVGPTERSPLDLTVVVDPGVGGHPRRIIVHSGSRVKLMVEYNRVVFYQGIYIAEQIRLYRARMWKAPMANRSLPITDSLDIELVATEVAEPGGNEHWGATSHESD